MSAALGPDGPRDLPNANTRREGLPKAAKKFKGELSVWQTSKAIKLTKWLRAGRNAASVPAGSVWRTYAKRNEVVIGWRLFPPVRRAGQVSRIHHPARAQVQVDRILPDGSNGGLQRDPSPCRQGQHNKP